MYGPLLHGCDENTYHVQQCAADSTVACCMGITPQTGIKARVVLCFHARGNVGRVGTLPDIIVEVASQAVVRGLDDTPVLVQMQGDVDKGPIFDTVPAFAAKTGVGVEHDRVGDVVAVVGVHHLVPVRLVARVVTLGTKERLVRVHEVAMPGKKGALFFYQLSDSTLLCSSFPQQKYGTYHAVNKVGLHKMSVGNLIPAVLGDLDPRLGRRAHEA